MHFISAVLAGGRLRLFAQRPHLWVSLIIAFGWLAWPASSQADSDLLRSLDKTVWSKGALLCGLELPVNDLAPIYNVCPNGTVCFPGEGRESPQGAQCGDGDMTLFSSLLCVSGNKSGCDAVSEAQNRITGQWYRSPRLRKYPRLRTTNTFSPDMALGVLLWASMNPAQAAPQLSYWIDWLARTQRCASEGCTTRIPRFCPDDDVDGDPGAEFGCTMRPGDAATLGLVISKFGVKVNDPSLKRTFDKWRPQAVELVVSSALLNNPGYAQHLVGVNILVLWRMGVTDKRLEQAALHLSQKQPQNPFFAWLSGAEASRLEGLMLAKCPQQAEDLPVESQRRDWTWQREDSSDAWKRMMVWDCRFMASLITNNVLPKRIVK